MILIVDSGSTKTIWAFVVNNNEVLKFRTEGFNPCYMEGSDIKKMMQASLPCEEFRESISYIFFYGAGFYEEHNVIFYNVFSFFFPNAKIYLAMDILGAARALLGTQEGFAAILGTGTNTCIYDGETIALNVDSLGFLLGDEGSGGHIGKKILIDYMRGYMPISVKKLFYDSFHLSAEELLLQLYGCKLPNKFCASFVPFLTKSDVEIDYTYNVIRGSFSSFFKNIVCKYPNYQNYKLNVVGSIGWYFVDILRDVSLEYGMELGKVVQDPISDLVIFHSYSKYERV